MTRQTGGPKTRFGDKGAVTEAEVCIVQKGSCLAMPARHANSTKVSTLEITRGNYEKKWLQ